MGGNTIRMVEHLLQNGASEEEAATGESTSPLFKTNRPGGGNWIQSIHAIAAPFDGTPMMELGQSILSFSKEMLLTFGLVAGISSLKLDWLYDFDLGKCENEESLTFSGWMTNHVILLDQFGIQRQNGESFEDYFNRVFASSALQENFVDNAFYDLTLDGAAEFNAKAKLTYPNTYYFTYTSSQTFQCDIFGDHCPEADMEIFLAPTGFILGHLGNFVCTKKGACTDRQWAENDGVVPRRSSRSPQNGVQNFVAVTPYPTKCKLFKCDFDNSAIKPGTWYTR
jgi:triacylglycerol lipase